MRFARPEHRPMLARIVDKALDKAEEFTGDPLQDPRVVEWEEQLRSEFREELALQQAAFSEKLATFNADEALKKEISTALEILGEPDGDLVDVVTRRPSVVAPAKLQALEAELKAARAEARRADEARGAARAATAKLEKVEDELTTARGEARRAETARVNLERVVRAFEAGKDRELNELKAAFKAERNDLETRLEDMTRRAQEAEAKAKVSQGALDEVQLQLARAVAEARAARAAANAATQNANRRANKPPLVNKVLHDKKPDKKPPEKTGFAALLIQMVDDELGT